MSKKIIIGIIILVAVLVSIYLYTSGFFGGAGTIPGFERIQIPSPPPLPE